MPYKNTKQDEPCFTQFIKKKKQIKGASRPSLSLTEPSD